MIYNPRRDPRRESYDPPPNPKPWYRRFVDFIHEGHKFLVAFTAICAATLVLHAWLRGLVRTSDVDASVIAAVSKAMTETNARVKDLEDRTGGLPTWRGETTVRDAVQDTTLQDLKARTFAMETRLENMRQRR